MNRRLIILVFCLAGCDISGLVLPLGSPATPAPAAARTSSNDISSYKTLVRTVARVAGAREIALLKPLVTRRLSSSLDEVIANNADRFWKHLEVLRRPVRTAELRSPSVLIMAGPPSSSSVKRMGSPA